MNKRLQEQKGEAFRELHMKFEAKKEQALQDLRQKLDMPFSGPLVKRKESRSM